MFIESIPPGESFPTGAAQEGIQRHLVDVLHVLSDVLLGHERLVAELALLRLALTADFDVAGEICAVGVTTPALGALVGLDPVVFVHVTLELDFMSEASVADFALEDELVSVERHVVAEAVFALVDLGAAGVRTEVLLAQVDGPDVLVEATFLHVFLTALVALKF